MPFVQILLYVSVLFFVVAVVARSVRYARSPVHLRWELYPVAHEKGRAAYGGSIFEEPQWWRRPRRPDHLGAARAMTAEILLLAGVRRHNPRLWPRSLAFHAGLYVAGLWVLATLVAGATGAGGLRSLIATLGYAGLSLTLLGAVALLAGRVSDRKLRPYSAPSDLLNLGIFILWSAVTLAVHLRGEGFAAAPAQAAAWLALRPMPLADGEAVALALGAVILVWLPLSRMFHFVAKYFLYHRVRWEDEPNVRGSRLERRLQQAMDFGLGWQAPHVGGARTWAGALADSSTEEPR